MIRRFLNSHIQADSTAVTTAGTAITFKQRMRGTYKIDYRCLDSNGDGVGVTISNQTELGFTATPIANGTLHWTATKTGRF